MIYFDNAATTGHKPKSVVDAVNNALKFLSANPGRSGHKPSQRAAIAVYEAREKVSDFFNSDGPETVVFTPNCTQSINYVLKGDLGRNDHIVISDLEHNAVMRPLKSMNIDFTMAQVSLEDDNITLQNFKKAINQNTKMVFCTAASNVLGKALPLEDIGAICKRNGILFGVDAAQGAGVMDINMKDMNIDYLCIAAHKGLYCPMGLGILIARGPIKKTIIEGGTGTDSVNFIQPDILPEMLESGTVNLPAIASVGAGIDFVRKRKNCILKYENNLVKQLYNGLQGSNVVFYTNPNNTGYVPVICFNVNGYSSDEVTDILSKNGFALRAGLHCAPTAHKKIGTQQQGTVRFSPSVFNNANEVDELIIQLKNFKNYQKHY
ncbi:MAG: aminotransferase class V-fold PLP-dependent enzyme [Clostridia bacterium]|nr:aminotransferase class V-fold PLP-dependent enzyme [Clostridia bacterium]